MGEIPNKPLFSVKLWLAIVLVVSASVRVFGVQIPVAQAATSPPQQSPVAERKAIGPEQVPSEKKADILMARGEYAAAITAYQQGNLKSAIVWNNIGMAYHHLFALEEARKAYQQALTLNPRFAPAANNLAAVYYGQHEFRVAEHWYRKALKHPSESAVIYCNLGTAYFAEDKIKKSIKMYQKAFSIGPDVFSPPRAAMVEGGGSREQRVAIN